MNQPPPFKNVPLNQTLAMLHAIYAGIMGLSGVLFVYLEYQNTTTPREILWGVLLMLGVLIFLNLWASIQVKRGQDRGRTLSRVMSVLMLLSFPLGTVLGLIALWKSTEKQWQR